MIAVIKTRGSINCWEAVRFSVTRKDNDQGGRLLIIYPYLLVWEAERKILQNVDVLVDCCNQ